MIRFIAVARDEHVRVRAQGRPADPARAGARRTRAPSSGALAELVDVSRACGVDFVFCVSPGPLDALLGRGGPRGAREQARAASPRSASTRVRAAARRHPAGAPAPRGPGGVRRPRGRPRRASPTASRERLGRGPASSCAPRSTGARGREPYLADAGLGARPAHRPVLDGARDLLADARRRRRAPCSTRTARRPADLLGQLPGQRRRDGLRAAHRALPRARPAPVARHAFGVVANGMELFEASKIPFATIADYLARPRGLRPGDELAAGDPRRRGRGGPRGLRAVRGQRALIVPVAVDDAPIVDARRSRRSRSEVDQGDAALAAARTSRDLADRARWPRRTTCCAGRSRTARSIDECRPWIEAFEMGAQAIVPRRRPRRGGPPASADATAELRPYLVGAAPAHASACSGTPST